MLYIAKKSSNSGAARSLEIAIEGPPAKSGQHRQFLNRHGSERGRLTMSIERDRLTSMYAYARKGQFAIPDDVTFVSRVPSVASIEVAVGNIQRSDSILGSARAPRAE